MVGGTIPGREYASVEMTVSLSGDGTRLAVGGPFLTLAYGVYDENGSFTGGGVEVSEQLSVAY